MRKIFYYFFKIILQTKFFLRFPDDPRTFRINNQWLWGDKLMVSVGINPVYKLFKGGLSQVYLPKSEWYEYYRVSLNII